MYTITINHLTLANLTLAQLDAFITAGMAAIPGAELTSLDISVTQSSSAPAPAPTAGSPS